MYLLRALAFSNTLLLLTNLLIRTLVQIGQKTDLLSNYMAWFEDTVWFWHPLPDVFHMAAVYYILLVAVDRYLLVYHPALGERLCRPALVICYILIIMITAILCFTPKFFEPKKFDFAHDAFLNGSAGNLSVSADLIRGRSALASVEQTASKIVYDAFDCFIQSILPTFCTAFFNLLLIKALNKVSHSFLLDFISLFRLHKP